MIQISLDKAIKNVLNLSKKIEEVGKGYFHTTPLSSTNSIFGTRLDYSLFDWGLLGAISEAPVLLIGDTDRGKTDFAKIIMTALFGDEEKAWHKTNIDLDFGSLTYSGTDFSSIHDGKKSDELFYEKDFLKYPGLIWDEPNRAPAKLLNKLIHILEKNFHLENGKKVLSGKEYIKSNGEHERYQYHILAMNEGADFYGTSMVDRALRRRQTIEIPVDVFPSTMMDKKRMGEERTGDLEIKNGEGSFNEIIEILNSLPSIPISNEAEQLRLYLQSMSYCVASLTKTKKGINFGEQICKSEIAISGNQEGFKKDKTGCHYLASYPNRMCPNIYGITDGVSIRFGTISRAHALLRAAKTLESIIGYIRLQESNKVSDYRKRAARSQALKQFYSSLSNYIGGEKISEKDIIPRFVEKYIENIKVEPIDFYAVMPFISYSKLQINPHWVEKNYQGSRWFAIKHISKVAYDNVTTFQKNHEDIFKVITSGEKIGSAIINYIEEECKNDLWLKQSLIPYLQKSIPTNNNYEAVIELLNK